MVCYVSRRRVEATLTSIASIKVYTVEEDEWQQIKALPLLDLSNRSDSLSGGFSQEISRVTSSVNLDEVLSYFQTLDVTNQMVSLTILSLSVF